jgi:undecaprenyl-diphosphatase
VREYVHGFAAPTLTVVMQTASFLGSTLFLWLLGAVIVIIFFWLKRPRAAVIFIITTVGASLLIALLKAAFRRPRPEPFFNTILPTSDSFPSGHALASFCFYGALAAIIIVRIENFSIKIIVCLAATGLIAMIGLSRIYLGVHYPSDVLAGYAVGLIWVMTIAIGDRLNHVRDKSVIEAEK